MDRGKLEFKEFPVSEVKILDEEQRIIRGWISTEDRDEYDDIMEAIGCDDSEYDGVVLAGHRSEPEYVVGNGKIIQKVEGKGVEAEWQLARGEPGIPLMADQIWLLIKQKMLKKLSIGFRAIEWVTEQIGDSWIRRVTKWKIYEFSHVGLAANRTAEITAVKALLDAISAGDKPSPESKAAVPFKGWPKADEATPWSFAAADASDILGDPDSPDWDRYKAAHAWFDPEAAEARSGYKLPHHKLIDGQMTTIWRGVAAAMGALLGARDGADIPDADKPAVHAHLAKHYAEFEKEPPELKGYSAPELRDMFPELALKSSTYDPGQETVTLLNTANLFKAYVTTEVKSGRVLSSANENRLRNAMEVISEILAQLGESDDETGKSQQPIQTQDPLALIASDPVAVQELAKGLAAFVTAA